MNDQTPPSRLKFVAPQGENREGSELGHLLGVASEQRWLIIGVTAAVFAISLLYAFLRPPLYEATTVMQVLAQQSGGLSGLEQLSAIVQGSAVPTETEIQLLQTRAVLFPVIRKLHLDILVDRPGLPLVGPLMHAGEPPPATVSLFEVPQGLERRSFTITRTGPRDYRLTAPDGATVLNGHVGQPATGPVMDRGIAGIVNLRVDSIADGGSAFSIRHIPIDQAAAALLETLSIEEVGKQTGVISVSTRGGSPEAIATELNAIAEANVLQNIRQNSSQAASQLDFLTTQVPVLEGRFLDSQSKLAQFLTSHPPVAALSQDMKFIVDQAGEVDKQLGPLEAQVAEARIVLGAQNPKLAVLEAQLKALTEKRSALLGGITKLPQDQQTLVRLQSDVQINQAIYTALMNQMETLQIAKAGTVGDVVIVDQAVPPSFPTAPNKPLDAAIGLFLGAVLGVLAAFARRAVRQGIDDPEALDEQLGIPVLAVLAHSPKQRRLIRSRKTAPASLEGLLSAQSADDQTVEGLRSLRTALNLALPKSGRRILAVMSLGPGEGKSFISGNLAYLFAQNGARVLLIDADLRRGRVHGMFGWERGKGMTDVLRGELAVDAAIRKTQLETLDVITTGTLPDDPGHLLTGADIGNLLNRASSGYDLVVVDVPPVLAVGDAFVIGRHTTLNLLLLKHGLHSLRQVRLIVKRFARHDIGLAGFVLNDVSAAAQRYAFREYGYQYQYQYK